MELARDTFSPLEIAIKDEIAHNLQNLKKINGYTQKEIIEGTGLTQGAISRYFLGKRMPTQQNLQILADFFNVPVETIDPRQKAPQNIITNSTTQGVNGHNSGTINITNGKYQADKDYDTNMYEFGSQDQQIQLEILKAIQKQSQQLDTIIELEKQLLNELKKQNN